MKPIRTLLIVLSLLSPITALAAPYQPPPSARAKYNFNAGWKLLAGDPAGAEAPGFDDGAWKNVSLPHAWNEDAAFRVSIDQLPTGIAWYRKHFRLPPTQAVPGSDGKKVFLQFEGIRHGGEFYLNGQSIGRSENGVMAFGFDVTKFVKPAPQENVLAARIDNAWNYHEKATDSTFQWNDRNFYANYGGINKNVYLHVTNNLYQTLPLYSNLGTTGVYVYAGDFDIKGESATITAESEVKNDDSTAKTFSYQVVIQDMNSNVVGTMNGQRTTLAPGATTTVRAGGRVTGLNFWSWGYGYLYNVYTILRVNNVPIDVVRTRTGFRKTEFRNGMVRLNDRAIQMHGYAQRTTNEWPAIGLSVPAWVSDFSNRLMVQGNANLVRWMHVTPWKQDVESCDRVGLMEAMPAGDSEGDVTGRRWDLRLEVMRDAIIYNRNNPSIIFYESGNKGVREEHMAQMKALRDQYDPHGGRASGSREMQDSKIAEYGGEMLYINKSATKPMWAMEYSRDESLRKWWDEFSPPYHKDGTTAGTDTQGAAYNRNGDSFAVEDVTRWYDYWRERPGTGTRVNAGGVNIIFSDSNTHHRGEESYRRSGEVDAMRIPKDGYFANQVMWDGWVDVEHPRIHVIGHWNYVAGVKKTVQVVSSADKVQLFLNGQSLGWGEQSNRFLFSFKDVAWQPGTLRAVGTDTAGKPLCEAMLQTVGAPAAIKLTPTVGPGGWQANGADLALVDVEVVDAQGRRCPTALNAITFALSGPVEWRGGIAQGPDNDILAKTLPVEGGINRVILRSLPQPGSITLNATADGLKPAAITLPTKAAPVTDGFSLDLPGTNLPSYLDRGPTPATDSVHPTRTPVRIASVTAGANAEKAAQSYDDNEATDWSNDGKRATGWIEYAFAQPVTISEVTLKLGGWRTKTYPIRILVDGKAVYAGTTPASLGYVTLTFAPTMGKSLRIELTGNTGKAGTFGDVTELNNPANAATTGDTGNAKGTLDIVEAEIYGPVR